MPRLAGLLQPGPVARRLAAALAAALLVAAPLPGGASERADSARRAAGYLVGRQQPNGAFFSSDEQAHVVAETVTAVVAGGVSGDPVRRALGYIASQDGEEAASTAGRAGLLVMGIVAGGANPADFGGFDYVAQLQGFYSPATGAYEEHLFRHSLAILGRAAARAEVPAKALDYLVLSQCANGGFSWQVACAASPDTDTTSVAVMALAAAGRHEDADDMAQARQFLLGAQGADGGYPLTAGGQTNGNSTGLALAAIVALGEDAEASPWRQGDGDDPAAALRRLQHDSGGYRYVASGQEADDFATRQAVPGMAGRALPVRPVGAPAPRERSGSSRERTEVLDADAVREPQEGHGPSPSPAAATTFAGPAPAGPPIAIGGPPAPTAGRPLLPLVVAAAGAGASAVLLALRLKARPSR